MHHNPLVPDGAEALAGYTPIQLAPRHNGWTAARQRAFLTALAETGSVSAACRAAGITARSAYRLRGDPRGKPFARAWDHAIYIATDALVATAFERATKGGYREVWKDGELIQETRQPSDSMLRFLLTHLAPRLFNAPAHFNDEFARAARREFPDCLDALTDCEVRADRLTTADFEAQPRVTAHDPLIPPRQEAQTWAREDDYDPDQPDALEGDAEYDPDAEDGPPAVESGDAGEDARGRRAPARGRDSCDSGTQPNRRSRRAGAARARRAKGS